MKDDDPIDREPNRVYMDPPLRRDEPMVERESALTTLGIFAALVVAIGAGIYFWTATSSGQQQVASNNTPAITAPPTPDTSKTDSK